ncbi:MAG: hypothetical protein IJS14_06650 [Lentisphaeria bacterium]|nr:hypothetical protein [Lentisphaeria bacterium]
MDMNMDPAFLKKILHGFAEVVRDDDGSFRLFRVPCALLPKLGKRVNVRCYHAAGSELRFRMGDTPVRFIIRRITEPDHPLFTAQTVVPVGIFHGDFQYDWLALQEGDNEIVIKPFEDPSGLRYRLHRRFRTELTRIVLPPFVELRIIGWQGEMEPPHPGDEPARQLLAYGSSITQGAYSPLGTETYPAVLARELGVDVCNLGFGGGATLEPELAEWIVSRTDWHLATLEMGVNVFNLSVDDFRKLVRNFLAPFAADPLERPVYSLDMLTTGDEFRRDETGMAKAAAFRQVVREETAATGKSRMKTLTYAPMLAGPSDYSTDLIHPALHAFESIGRGLAAQIMAAEK